MISKVLQDAVDEFAQLPGVGQKTAFRFVLHLLKKNPQELERFGNTFLTLKENVRHCCPGKYAAITPNARAALEHQIA